MIRLLLTKGSERRRVLALLTAGSAIVLVVWYFAFHPPPIPQRTLRIGFEQVPPVQIRTANGFEGLAVETVNEAARRAGISLQWVETGTSSDEAFARGLVDLWPIMADLPERRKRVHISQAWMHSSHILLLPSGSGTPTRKFAGRIAVFKMPLHLNLAKTAFPAAQLIQFAETRTIVKEVCSGAVAAGFLADRVVVGALREKPPECAAMTLRVSALPELTVRLGVASTFEAAGAADAIRREISGLYRDGTFAGTVAKYSYYGLDDTWATYDLMQSAERARWLAWGLGATAIAFAVTLWQAATLRQRKRSESAIRESEENFRAIFHQAAVGVAEVNLEGEITLVNARYCEVLGYQREELLGSNWLDKTHPDDFAAIEAHRRQLLAGETSSYSLETQCFRKDKELRWVKLFGSLVRDPSNRPRYFVSVVEDITERKQMEAALQESEKRFRNIADTAPVMIWIAGADQHCTFFNQSWLTFTGVPLDQALGAGWSEAVHPEDRESCYSNYTSAFAERRSFQTECRLRRADGDYRWVLATGVPRFDPSHAFAGFVGSCTDTTDVKRAQAEALASQKLEGLGVLAGGIAHDFNNLLGSILATSELILSDLPAGGSVRNGVESITRLADRAAEIVGQMLAYAGTEDKVFEPADLSRLVGEMLELIKVSISKRAVLKVDLPADLPPVLINAAQIRRVVMNLITNASEALGEREGAISVSLAQVRSGTRPIAGQDQGAPPRDHLRLAVTDTGIGMTEEVRARIFDPFFTTKFIGRGLGLSAVQGIIRDHGGTISVTSSPGRGSVFEILLPCTGQPVPDATQTPARVPAPNSEMARGKVLVVEDEDDLRFAVSKMLRKQGFSVIEASDGLAGVDMFRTNQSDVDAVLLDLTLPRLSGQEVLDELFRLRPGIKVIIATAYSRDTAQKALGREHMWHYIRKPYRIGDVTELLGKVCSQARTGSTAGG